MQRLLSLVLIFSLLVNCSTLRVCWFEQWVLSATTSANSGCSDQCAGSKSERTGVCFTSPSEAEDQTPEPTTYCCSACKTTLTPSSTDGTTVTLHVMLDTWSVVLTDYRLPPCYHMVLPVSTPIPIYDRVSLPLLI